MKCNSGESIEVEADVLACPNCGEGSYCERLDCLTLRNAYNEYRKRHNLLLLEEVCIRIEKSKVAMLII